MLLPCQIINLQTNSIGRLLENLRKEKFIHLLETIFWGVGLVDMQWLSKYKRGIRYLLCTIDLFSKYAWVVPLKDKRGISIVNAFQKIASKGRKPNKIWVNKGSEFENYLFKRVLKKINIKMYSIYNQGKSVVAEKFIRALKNKIYKHMTAVLNNFYCDVLDDIIKKYNNKVHRTIKMKPIDVTSDFYAAYNEDSNENDPKFKVADRVRTTR